VLHRKLKSKKFKLKIITFFLGIKNVKHSHLTILSLFNIWCQCVDYEIFVFAHSLRCLYSSTQKVYFIGKPRVEDVTRCVYKYKINSNIFVLFWFLGTYGSKFFVFVMLTFKLNPILPANYRYAPGKD